MSFRIKRIDADLDVTALFDNAWSSADEVLIDRYWSGGEAPQGRHFRTRALWSDAALHVRFEANRAERIIVSDWPDVSQKTFGLWERDVCEIFIAPARSEPRLYFEFEVAPTGEWLDVAIDLTSGTRTSDWAYASDMNTAAKVELEHIMMAMRIPWTAFGKAPAAGDVWLGNLYRCVGEGPERGYLSWQRTMTPTPDFHVPESFSEFQFVA